MKLIVYLLMLVFGCQKVMAQLPSAAFENWTNYTVITTPLQVPNNWHGLDSSIAYYGFLLNPFETVNPQVAKETPGNAGSLAALKVITRDQTALNGVVAPGPIPSLASNAVISINTATFGFDLIGGWPYTNNPESISMWVKNLPIGGDSTGITVLAIDNSDGADSIAATADTMLGATINTWTKITLPFTYSPSGFTTTLIRVLISSSGNFGSDSSSGAFTNLHDGTSLSVDDIEIAAPNGIIQYVYSSNIAKVYPTQCIDNLHINLQTIDGEAYSFQIFDMNACLLKSLPISSLINTFNLSDLAKGNYIFALSKNNQLLQSGKFQKM